MRSLRDDALDQFLDGCGLVALRFVFGFDDKGHAAFGFLRARRPVRAPDSDLAVIALEFRAAVADQVFQRIGGGLDAERFHLAARRPGQRLVVVFRRRQAELAREFRIERRDGRRGAVVGLGGFFEALRRCIAFGNVFAGSLGRGARAMRRGLAAGAAVPRIVRRRLQAGAGAHAGIAAVDRGIEQFGQRRSDRLHVRPRRLRTWRLGFRGFGFFRNFGSLRHDGNMGLRQAAEKAGIVNPPCRSAADAPAPELLPTADKSRCRTKREALTAKNSL